MALITVDIQNLFEQQFGSKPVVPNIDPKLYDGGRGEMPRVQGQNSQQTHTKRGSLLADTIKGIEIWLPVKFTSADLTDSELYLPYSVISIAGRKTIIKTPLAERKGSVKEQYNIDDYTVTVKGFLIGENRQFPEKEIEALKQLFETQKAVRMHNAITNIFLQPENGESHLAGELHRVVITDLSMPEVEGGRKHIRPFVLQVESDTIFTLELE